MEIMSNTQILINIEKFRKSTVIVIPALNEAGNIYKVITGLVDKYSVIVIDDGSTDSTKIISEKAGALVFSNEKNLGYDYSIHKGILKAIELGYKYAITVDADGQHPAAYVDLYVNELANNIKIVLGTREKKARFSEYLFSIVGTFFWGTKDLLCGMKGYNLSTYQKYLPYDHEVSIGTDAIIKIIKFDLSYAEIKLRTNTRDGCSKFGNSIVSNLKIIKALLFLLKKHEINNFFNISKKVK
jgi:glycosyltransferase involved in cell wall biosynthesis